MRRIFVKHRGKDGNFIEIQLRNGRSRLNAESGLDRRDAPVGDAGQLTHVRFERCQVVGVEFGQVPVSGRTRNDLH